MHGVKLPVALLFIVFGWSSWIDVNGLWVELPLLVHKLPELWNLPAYITVLIQVANIGPLFYGIVTYALRKQRLSTDTSSSKLETGVIFSITTVGALATLLLSYYWDVTSFVGGVEHSTVLLILVFFLSLVDCTSSVTFLPFLAHFKPGYMTAFYVGEGMSGLLPTAIAFIQGSGEYTCASTAVNGTDNSTASTLTPRYSDLLFSVRDFFITLFVMLAASIAAFSVLRFSRYCQAERTSEGDMTPPVEYHRVVKSAQQNCTVGSEDSTTSITSPIVPEQVAVTLSSRQFYFLLAVMAFVCALMNGFLPSIQIYSLLPYGQLTYSLGVKLSTLANPLACFLGFCLMPQSFKVVGVLTCISAISAVYITVIASFSPQPPVEGVAAAVVMVMVWVVFTATSAYLRLLISRLMMRRGHSGLLWLGVFTQIGSCSGAVVSFLLTTIFKLFHSAPSC